VVAVLVAMAVAMAAVVVVVDEAADVDALPPRGIKLLTLREKKSSILVTATSPMAGSFVQVEERMSS